MSKMAAIFFNRAVKDNKLDAVIVNMVHDEIVVETKKEIADQVLELLVLSMKRAGNILIKSLPVEAKGKVTEYWDH